MRLRSEKRRRFSCLIYRKTAAAVFADEFFRLNNPLYKKANTTYKRLATCE